VGFTPSDDVSGVREKFNWEIILQPTVSEQDIPCHIGFSLLQVMGGVPAHANGQNLVTMRYTGDIAREAMAKRVKDEEEDPRVLAASLKEFVQQRIRSKMAYLQMMKLGKQAEAVILPLVSAQIKSAGILVDQVFNLIEKRRRAAGNTDRLKDNQYLQDVIGAILLRSTDEIPAYEVAALKRAKMAKKRDSVSDRDDDSSEEDERLSKKRKARSMP
jgi:hypothetical protein